jgi:hypothetical protein
MKDDGNPKPEGRRGIQWWKLGVGFPLLFLGIRALFFPDPNLPDALKYSNATEQFSGNLVQIILCIVALWLIVSGLRSALRKPPN